MSKKILTALSVLVLSLSSLLALTAGATELPAGVISYLRQKDPQVKVRFDGLVLFSNGETYVPIIPQDPALNPEPQQVVLSLPDKASYPDLVEFDNHFFLLRLIETSSGRLTFPKLAEYPLQLKEGLLPQDFVLPNNLFIPVELKVILGALPYNPVYSPVNAPVLTPAALTLSQAKPTEALAVPVKTVPSVPRVSYIFDLGEQKVFSIDALSGRKTGDVSMACVPSSLQVSGDGKLLFAPCLSTNELVVVDTGSNLVKTRIPVGQRPDSALYVEKTNEVVVSNRFSPYLSIIKEDELLSGEKISLPGNGATMAAVPGDMAGRIAVADVAKAQIYIVNTDARSVEKTLKALPNVSAMWFDRLTDGRLRLWAASRSKHQVQAIDVATGAVVKTFEVGDKPVGLAAYGNKMFVVSAGSARLDVIDRGAMTLLDPVTLPDESFPSGIVSLPSEKKAFVTTAGTSNLIVLNMEAGMLETTLSVEFRASMMSMTPDIDTRGVVPETATTERLPSITEMGSPAAADDVTLSVDKKEPKAEHKGLTGGRFKKQPKPSDLPPASVQHEAAESAQSAPKTYIPTVDNGALPTQNSGKVSFQLGKSKSKKQQDAETAPVESVPQEASRKSEAKSEAKPLARPEASSDDDASDSSSLGEPPAMLDQSVIK